MPSYDLFHLAAWANGLDEMVHSVFVWLTSLVGLHMFIVNLFMVFIGHVRRWG